VTRVEDELDWPPQLFDTFGVHPELVNQVDREAGEHHLRWNTKSGNGIHFCRRAVAKLKYSLEWWAWCVAPISRTRWAIR
jgi:hypothetical protein